MNKTRLKSENHLSTIGCSSLFITHIFPHLLETNKLLIYFFMTEPPCERVNNGGCDQKCVPDGEGGNTCTCDQEHYKLGADGKSCQEGM